MIEIVGLSKTYAGTGRPALNDVSLHVPGGAVYGILGRSGAGKSTLIRCLNLLERPTAGRIIVNGNDITRMDKSALREYRLRTGMIFQHFNLLHARSVADNVAVPLEIAKVPKAARQARVAELLELVGLADKAAAFPSQLSGGQKQRVGIARALAARPDVLLCDEATSALDPETTASVLNLLADKAAAFPSQLSGGQKQRVGIARALAARPDVLLCDEATSALDPETTASVLSLLADINQQLNLTIVLITHELDVVKTLCDHAALLEHGEIIESGRIADLLVAPWSRLRQSLLHDPQAERDFLARHGFHGRPLCGVA